MTHSTGVVIAAHNAAATIERTVQSVCEQAHPPARLIVVADACHDATADRAERAGAEVHTVEAHSAAIARHTGVLELDTDWIAFLDADDLWHPGWLAAVNGVIQQASDAGLIVGQTRVLTLEGRYPGPAIPDSAGDHFARLLCDAFITTSATVVNRGAYDAAGGFDCTFSGAGVEDYDLWLRIAAGFPVAPVPGIHVDYSHIGTGSIRDPGYFARRREETLSVISSVAKTRNPGGQTIRRARANAYRMSAERYLAAGSRLAAMTDLLQSAREWPLDTRAFELWSALCIPPTLFPWAVRLRRELKSWQGRDS